MDDRKNFDVTFKKCSIEEKDIDQIKKYLNSKGFKLKKEENNPKFLYISEKSYILVHIIMDMPKYEVLNYKAFQYEIYKPIKESVGKTFYELDWRFVQQLAERMQTNKKKYPPYNWKKEMDKESLEEIKQATVRHFIEFTEDNFEDDGREFGHIEAIVCNLMMYNYQIKNYG